MDRRAAEENASVVNALDRSRSASKSTTLIFGNENERFFVLVT
jgi:hypothetical protein